MTEKRNPFETLRENPFEDATARIRQDRNDAAELALDALRKLQRSLEETTIEIEAALEGEPVRPSYFTPNRQYLGEVVEWGSKFESLWRSLGTLERNAR